MKNKVEFDEIGGREWLIARYNRKETRFAYPPVVGTHQECFQAISKDSELRATQGLELALLTQGAYTQGTEKWKSVRNNFANNYVRIPIRNLWVPKGSVESDRDLSGVFIERDSKGIGLSAKMQIPENLSGWKQENGVYVSSDKAVTFVPSDKYKLGEHDVKSFSKDGYAISVLTEEGAEMFVKTAKDTEKTPWTWGVDVNSISAPKQRVSLLYGYGDRLVLDGYGLIGGRYCRAFGVLKSGEASALKK